MKLPWNRQLAVDTETNGLAIYDPTRHVTHISTWDNEGDGAVHKLPMKEKARVALARKLLDRDLLKLFFNTTFDIPFLAKAGFKVAGPVIDVKAVSQLCFPDEHKHDLKGMAKNHLHVNYDEKTKVKQWLKDNKVDDWSLVPDHIMFPYALRDAQYTLELFHYMWPILTELKLWGTLCREMKVSRVVMAMEKRGILVDSEHADHLAKLVKWEAKKLKAKICKAVDNPSFNPNSPKQLVDVLYKDGTMPEHFTKKGAPATHKVALIDLDTPLGWDVIKYRQLTKAGGSYLQAVADGVDHRGRFRVSFNQTEARTGRFSSSGYGGQKFNMQNIPRSQEGTGVLGRIRECFVAPPGHWLVFIDLEQVEMRLTAHFSEEKHMLEAIHQGLDLHGETCKKVFGKTPQDSDWSVYRYLAKTLNFAVIYGAGARTFVNTVLEGSNGDVRITMEEAEAYLAAYDQAHPGLAGLFNRLELEVVATGGVRTPYGRFIQVPDAKPYAAVNYAIQGTAADYIKVAMLRCSRLLQNRRTSMVLQVHDELVFEVPHAERGLVGPLKRAMEDYHSFKVPITASVSAGKRWSQKRPVAVK